MKTIVIWNCFSEGLQFFVLDGDYSHLDQVFIGSTEDEDKQDELLKLTSLEDGDSIPMLDKFPTYVFYENEGTLNTIIVIECGYFP